MKLTVKNFGPIREAKNITVSPMTIFVGPSNTGKSYLAILIYSVIKVFGGRWTTVSIGDAINLCIEEDEDDDLLTRSTKDSMEDVLPEKIDKRFYAWAESFSNLWKRELIYCLGETARYILDDETIDIKISDANGDLIVDLISPENSKLSKRKGKELYECANKDLYQKHAAGSHVFTSDDFNLSKFLINKFISIVMLKYYLKNSERIGTHYLPAVRGGIMQSHRTIVNSLIEQAPWAGLSGTSLPPPFNGVLSDFMRKLINVEDVAELYVGDKGRPPRQPNQNSSNIGESSKKIMGDIIGGMIGVKKSEVRYPDFRYVFEQNGKKHDIPMMSASSMVSELAPIFLFIEQHLRAGDLFIVEEPEAHLHPAAQRKISEILVQLVNAGVYVLVTTHSENIIEQIGNYVCASEINEPIKGISLKEHDTSTYVFQRPKSAHKNTIIKKVPFDNETGFLTSDHMDVSSALYNETIELLEKRNPNG